MKLNIVIPENIREFASRLPAPMYLVGGMVRNAIMGISGGDWDVCSRLTPDEVIALAQMSLGIKAVPRAPEFGTVELHIGGLMLEHTTFRRDSYGKTGEHRPESVVFAQTPAEDALRRDFTVNAIYYNLASGEAEDPLGGIADIEKKVIRTANRPEITLDEDGLRIMRMVRFACELGFSIDEVTMAKAAEMVWYLAHISRERIRDELSKILLSDVRYPELGNELAHKRGIRLLDEIGAIKYVLPGLEEGRGVAQREEYHAYDVLDHMIETCGFAPPRLNVRLAALLHDVAKPETAAEGGKMYGHDIKGEEKARKILGQGGLRYPNDIVDSVCRLIRLHMYDLNGETGIVKVKKMLAGLGREGSQDIIDLRRADILGSGRSGSLYTVEKWTRAREEMLDSGAPFSPDELNITGEDIMAALNIGEGPAIGRIKDYLFAHCVARPESNNKTALLRLAANFYKNARNTD